MTQIKTNAPVKKMTKAAAMYAEWNRLETLEERLRKKAERAAEQNISKNFVTKTNESAQIFEREITNRSIKNEKHYDQTKNTTNNNIALDKTKECMKALNYDKRQQTKKDFK